MPKSNENKKPDDGLDEEALEYERKLQRKKELLWQVDQLKRRVATEKKSRDNMKAFYEKYVHTLYLK